MKLLAPAKINWFLHVMDKRPDGYHEIMSLMQLINLYDEIEIEPEERLLVETELNIPQEENIAYKAACFLKKETGYKGGAIIRIKKNIPHGAGLGGGSSDAATTLIGLNKIWGLNLSIKELSEIGASLGSDVPFFLKGPAGVVSGRGEIIENIDIKESYVLLLVKPEFFISTAWAYNELERMRAKKEDIIGTEDKGVIRELIKSSIMNESFLYLIRDSVIFKNDLEIPVFNHYPFLREVKERLINEGSLYAAMTGSGSTIFGIFRTEREALKASKAFQGLWTKIVRTIVENKD
ncbi:MAG: 4-(cytidine 5'-diphospho)-2-C-methyl-D-erythritol kinase [Thermodesulfovibrionales bacterium]|nr:4-(cytidine 5'-diphospho)-2-C-methyl-D-erythritol kinase [Thermodesulfovibrionales bacterium]